MDSDTLTCYLCAKPEHHAYADNFDVRECQRCDQPVCQNCAEMDADCVGLEVRQKLASMARTTGA